jgi:SpoVK/Ycf46/Vps4 family AAA+-type ATPase
MSEDHPNVFIIATANDISALNRNHPELLRKGRFDEIWFSDCPTEEEREEIFKIHLRRNGRDPSKFDLKKLAKIEYEDENSSKTYTYTGAEIEYAVQDAIQEAFAKGGGKKLEVGSKDDVATDDIAGKLKIIKPITYISKDPIGAMRRWAEKNARKVSGTVEKKKDGAGAKGPNLNMRASLAEDIDII